MPMPFPIKQGHAANLKPKGRRSKRYGVSSRPNLPQRKERGTGENPFPSQLIGHPMIDKDSRMMR